MDSSAITGEQVTGEINADFNGCRLCWALSHRAQRFPSNIHIWSDSDYVLLPALGALVPGHLILVSRRHAPCLASLEAGQLASVSAKLSQLREKVLGRIASAWAAFEHGSTLARGVRACCIDHLHLHFIPLVYDLASDIAHRTSTPAVALTSLQDLAAKAGSHPCNYILIENADRGLWVIEPPSYPSQYVRQVVASRLGIAAQWDWMKYTQVDNTLATLRLFRQEGVAPRQIYFAHAIEGVPPEELLAEILAARTAFSSDGANIKVASMFDLLDQAQAAPIAPKALVSIEIEFLRSCDALVVDLSRPGWQYAGALMEIVYAKVHHLPVIAIVGETSLGDRAWVKAHVDRSARTLNEAVQMTREILEASDGPAAAA